MWHVSSRSGVATLRTAIHLLLTHLLTYHEVSGTPSQIYFCVCLNNSILATSLYFSCFDYSVPDRGAEYCDNRVCLCVCLSVCLFVCLSASISPELHVRSSQNFVCMLPMAVARFYSGGVAICFVLPVLWLTSCLYIKVRNRRRKKRRPTLKVTCTSS